MQFAALGEALLDECEARILRAKRLGNGPAIALADRHDATALAVLVLRQAPVLAFLLPVFLPDMPANITAVHFGNRAGTAEVGVPHFSGHRLAQLVGQDEGRLVLDTEVAGQRQSCFAFDLVGENHDGGKIETERQLVEGEQRSRCDGEIFPARLAAEPAGSVRTAAFPAGNTAAMRADRLALGRGPADRPEQVFRRRVGESEHMSQRQGARLGGKEEMLAFGLAGHTITSVL